MSEAWVPLSLTGLTFSSRLYEARTYARDCNHGGDAGLIVKGRGACSATKQFEQPRGGAAAQTWGKRPRKGVLLEAEASSRPLTPTVFFYAS